MLKFAANLSMLYSEVPFLERFERAQDAGFTSVEFLFPYAFGLKDVRQTKNLHRLDIVLFNLPAGDWEKGERGIAILPDRVQDFQDGVAEAIHYAQALGTPRLNCLAGKKPDDLSKEDAWRTLLNNVRYAADELNKAGLTLVIEPINPFDIPGFFLNTTNQVLRLIEEAQRPSVKIQYDIYHMQRTQGDILNTYTALRQHIDHIQIADNPGRHQPGTGELHYGRIFQALEKAGYEGYIGLEYIPLGSTDESLSFWHRYRKGESVD